MVAQRYPSKEGSLPNVGAGAAAQVADGNLTCPSVELVDHASCRGDLPAESDQNCDCDQGAADHDGDSDAHQENLVVDSGPERFCGSCFRPLMRGTDDLAIALQDQILEILIRNRIFLRDLPKLIDGQWDIG